MQRAFIMKTFRVNSIALFQEKLVGPFIVIRVRLLLCQSTMKLATVT